VISGHRHRTAARALVAVAVLGIVTGCTQGAVTTQPSTTATSVRPTSPAAPQTTPPRPPTRAPSVLAQLTDADRAQPADLLAPPNADGPQLPQGGRAILGSYRVIAYYGGPGGPGLGALGDAPPERMAKVIAARAKQFAGYGLPVQPAMELIASVAQAGPGPDHLYSKTISPAIVQKYLDVAHRHHLLLILDFQPGRGEFLPQVQRFAEFLTDPSVSVALDPEWKMAAGQVPGTVIGSSRASSINRVGDYLAGIVRQHNLPDKLLMVHQFTLGMLPDRAKLRHYPGIELVLHADGFGSRAAKIGTYERLAFPGRPDGAGFKLFLTQDTGTLMSPAQVMALRPQPDVVTFQ
jgi:hypothetical protein